MPYTPEPNRKPIRIGTESDPTWVAAFLWAGHTYPIRIRFCVRFRHNASEGYFSGQSVPIFGHVDILLQLVDLVSHLFHKCRSSPGVCSLFFKMPTRKQKFKLLLLAYMYSKSEEDCLRLLRARGVVCTIWINPVIAEREEKGEHHLITDMRAYPEWFYEYMRMTPEQFDYIHSLIREDIRKMDTNYRDAIPTEHKLAAVIRCV